MFSRGVRSALAELVFSVETNLRSVRYHPEGPVRPRHLDWSTVLHRSFRSFFVLIALAFTSSACAASTASGSSPMRTETAHPAAAFVDSVGVNIHLSYHDGPYGNEAAVVRALRNLHVRHIRDGVARGQDGVCRTARAIAASGARFTYITQADLTTADLVAWSRCNGQAIEAYEGLNEYDIMHPAGVSDWATAVQESQRRLYAAVKGTPELASLAVVAPSLTSEDAFRAVGDLSAFTDYGTVHDYFGGREPEYESRPIGAEANMREARSMSGTKPIQATETGFGTSNGMQKQDIDEATQATYLPRLFLNQYLSGIVRTFDYELIDEGGPPFGAYGLLHSDLTPKPAYTALANLLALFEEPHSDAPRAPRSLQFAIDSPGASVRHALFAKRNGDLLLAVWQPASGYDTFFHRPTTVAPTDVTIRFAGVPRSLTAYRYDATGRMNGSALRPGSSLGISVTDRVSLIVVKPPVSR